MDQLISGLLAEGKSVIEVKTFIKQFIPGCDVLEGIIFGNNYLSVTKGEQVIFQVRLN